QVQEMIRLLLGLETAPSPHDVADALAVAICHLHTGTGVGAERVAAPKPASSLRSWRDYRPRRGLRGRCVLTSSDSMTASPKGTLLEKSPGRLVVDVHGVGYDVQVPLSTFYALGEPGSAVTLRVHTHVREEVIALFGFATRIEQDLFER